MPYEWPARHTQQIQQDRAPSTPPSGAVAVLTRTCTLIDHAHRPTLIDPRSGSRAVSHVHAHTMSHRHHSTPSKPLKTPQLPTHVQVCAGCSGVVWGGRIFKALTGVLVFVFGEHLQLERRLVQQVTQGRPYTRTCYVQFPFDLCVAGCQGHTQGPAHARVGQAPCCKRQHKHCSDLKQAGRQAGACMKHRLAYACAPCCTMCTQLHRTRVCRSHHRGRWRCDAAP